MTEPSENPPSPPILEYQRAEKAHRAATGGLMLMGIAITLLGGYGFLMALAAPWGFSVFRVIISLILPLWGLGYIATSILLRMRIRPAGWVALVMTGIMAVVCLFFSLRAAAIIVADGFEAWPRKLLIIFLLGLFNVGCIAIVVEVWQALRIRQIWRI